MLQSSCQYLERCDAKYIRTVFHLYVYTRIILINKTRDGEAGKDVVLMIPDPCIIITSGVTLKCHGKRLEHYLLDYTHVVISNVNIVILNQFYLINIPRYMNIDAYELCTTDLKNRYYLYYVYVIYHYVYIHK